MKEADRKARNAQRLTELYPTFRRRVDAVIKDLEARGLRPRIQDAYRSPADQLKAYNAGNSKLKYGFHNVTGKDGAKEALAVDLLDDDSPLKIGRPYLLNLADAAQRAGVITGIRWGVPKKLATAIDDAIAKQDWDAIVKIGWDPTHIEPVDVTVSQARKGDRPK